MMRNVFVALALLLCPLASAEAQMRVEVGVPSVNIGLDLPGYPGLVRVPGHPVYYSPGVAGNYFFFDGLYWVFTGDGWYASSWYNGPWSMVSPDEVPVYLLRVPVRYYRQPPQYFRGWRLDTAPRWGERWGDDWQHRRSGWDRWNRRDVPRAAPLPTYQRRYDRDRYPQQQQQQQLHGQYYRYQPRDPTVQRNYQEHGWRGQPQRGQDNPRVTPPPRQPDRSPGREPDRGHDHR
jgi:hypothetical protein